MINIEEIRKTNFFKEKTLERGDVLFDEGSSDNNLYYIISGKLIVEKYTTKERKITKQLAILSNGEFVGEGSLGHSYEKQVRIIVSEKINLLYIDAKNDFLNFMKSFPELARDILVKIIYLTNKRTLDGNKYITSIYEINKSINEIKNVNFHEIFKIFDKINLILEGKYLLFLDINNIDKEYLTLKYDSRKIGKMQDKLVKKGGYSLEEIGVENGDKIITKEILIGGESLGNIIIAKKYFNENEKRIFLAMMNSISGILKQKKILEEERDKEFSRH